MKNNLTLTITSLLAIVLMTFHFTHDIMHGVDDAKGMKVAALILVVWLCGTLLLSGRLWGYIITLLGGIISAAMPILHTMGSSPVKWGSFFFVWTLLALGLTGYFAIILSAIALWKLRRKPIGA